MARMECSATAAEINYDNVRQIKTGPQQLAEKLIAKELEFNRNVEKYLDEAIGECLLDDANQYSEHDILSMMKVAVLEDDVDLWIEASDYLFRASRKYIREI